VIGTAGVRKIAAQSQRPMRLRLRVMIHEIDALEGEARNHRAISSKVFASGARDIEGTSRQFFSVNSASAAADGGCRNGSSDTRIKVASGMKKAREP
jgi:hypothetical protein